MIIVVTNIIIVTIIIIITNPTKKRDNWPFLYFRIFRVCFGICYCVILKRK